MKYLLDSHAIIWSSLQPHKLSKTSSAIIGDSGNDTYVSLISFWEITLKYSIGKIDLHGGDTEDLFYWCQKEGFKILQLSENDVITFHHLPRALHKDPFDRMLVWQALNRQLTIISKDNLLRNYIPFGLKLVW